MARDDANYLYKALRSFRDRPGWPARHSNDVAGMARFVLATGGYDRSALPQAHHRHPLNRGRYAPPHRPPMQPPAIRILEFVVSRAIVAGWAAQRASSSRDYEKARTEWMIRFRTIKAVTNMTAEEAEARVRGSAREGWCFQVGEA